MLATSPSPFLKMLFLDVIIEDDPGEEEEEDIVPFQETKEATLPDMQIQEVKVLEWHYALALVLSHT